MTVPMVSKKSEIKKEKTRPRRAGCSAPRISSFPKVVKSGGAITPAGAWAMFESIATTVVSAIPIRSAPFTRLT